MANKYGEMAKYQRNIINGVIIMAWVENNMKIMKSEKDNRKRKKMKMNMKNNENKRGMAS
jgi:hypothetical protein